MYERNCEDEDYRDILLTIAFYSITPIVLIWWFLSLGTDYINKENMIAVVVFGSIVTIPYLFTYNMR